MRTDERLEVESRVHIMPMGFEKERILEPADRFKADEVVIVTHNRNKEQFDEYFNDVKEGLSELGLVPKTKSCNIFDVYDSLRAIGEAITSYEDDEVYVNLSAGSKITAIAGMIACMCSNARPYYAHAEDYSDTAPKDVTWINSLPKYRIDPPTADQIAILEYLKNVNDSTKLDLINFGEEANLDFLSDFSGKEKAKYRRLDRHIIKPLMESNYIDVNQNGRKRIVTLTDDGNQGRRAFKNLVEKGTYTDEEQKLERKSRPK